MKYKNPDIESSYKENDLGRTLYDLVLKEKPTTIIEFGTLYGYSAVAMAMALDELKADGVKREIICYDLWENYQYKKCSKGHAQDNIDKYGLGEYIRLANGDLFTWVSEPADLIHVDISNDGTKLPKIYDKLKGHDALVIFEGGSQKRDSAPWVSKYNKAPMRSCGIKYDVINEDYPSISKLIK